MNTFKGKFNVNADTFILMSKLNRSIVTKINSYQNLLFQDRIVKCQNKELEQGSVTE